MDGSRVRTLGSNDVATGGILAEGLSRRFGDVLAVAGVSFRVPPGALLALLGPNGAGKTTTVRMLAALLRPSAGRAVVAGYDVVAAPEEVRRRVGIVMDTPGLYEQMTARRYLDFFGRLYDLPATTRRERTGELLAMFDLETRTEEKIGGFSRGMKQKLALARALIHDPPVLFLDEPTASLDPASAKVVRDYVFQLKAGDRSIVLCTHDLDEAERLADEVAIVRGGRIVAHGTPDRLRRGANVANAPRYRLDLVAPEGSVPAEPAWDGLVSEVSAVERRNGALRVEFAGDANAEATTVAVRRALDAGWRIAGLVAADRSLEEVYLRTVGAGDDARATHTDDGSATK